MADKIKLRRDTLANWEAVNPILDEGEFGWISDKFIGKVGDGTHGFNDLRPAFNVPEGWVNVKDFGAKGDGITDDTLAVQEAVDSLQEYDVLFFPKGTYNITSQILITKNHIRITGNAIILVDKSLSILTFKIENSTFIEIDSLEFHTPFDYLTEEHNGISAHIYTINSEHIKIHNCYFNGSKAYAIRQEFSKYINIHNNILTKCLGTSIFGGGECLYVNIYNNLITHSKDDSIFQGNGQYATFASSFLNIFNNVILYSNAKAIGTGGWQNVNIYNNLIYETRSSAIDIEPKLGTFNWGYDAKNIKIFNNRIYNQGQWYNKEGAIFTEASQNAHAIMILSTEFLNENIEISHNHISNSLGCGIYIGKGNSNVLVSENYLDTIGNMGVSIGLDSLLDSSTINNIKIINNIIQSTNSMAIYISHANFNIIKNNFIYKSNITVTTMSSIRINYGTNTLIEENIIVDYNNADQGPIFVYNSSSVYNRFKNYAGNSFDTLTPISDNFSTGTTAQRPIGFTGQQYFDTDINKLITFDGTNWKDKNGNIV